MKILFTFFLLFFHYLLLSQNKPEKKETEQTLNEITKNVFKYADFMQGKIVYKDSTENDAKLNYSRVLGKVFYLDRMGKPVIVEAPETIALITILSDTFYFFDTSCVIKRTHFPKVNLYIRQTIFYTEKPNSSTNLDPVVVTNNSGLPYAKEQAQKEEGFDKNSMFKIVNDFFVADSSLNYSIVSKKNIENLFPSLKEQYKKYLQENGVNFNNDGDIEKLLAYMNSL